MSRAEQTLRPERSARDRFGYELRQLRKAHGMSQDRFAALAHVSDDLVNKIELAKRRPSRTFAETSDRILKAEGRLIQFWDDIDKEETTSDGYRGDAENLTPHDLESLRRNLALAIGEGAMTDSRIDDWEQTALRHGYATRDQPPRIMINALAADLTELKHYLLTCKSSSTLARITRVLAQMTGLMMLTFVKAGEQTAFHGWARTARLAANETGEPETQSWVWAQEAYGYYYGGNATEAIEIARHAQEFGQRTPCVGYVLASALEARAYASLSVDNREKVKSALGRAETVLSRLDAASTVPSAFGYNEEQLRFHESSALTRLHDTQAAWQAQERALELCPANDYTDRTLIQLDRASCLIQEHDIADAVDYATQAISAISEDQRRGIILLRADELINSLPADYHSHPSVQDLRDLLHTRPATGERQ